MILALIELRLVAMARNGGADLLTFPVICVRASAKPAFYYQRPHKVNSNNKQESPASEIESSLDKDLQLILKARHHDPFAVLGRHPIDGKEIFRAILPHAESARMGSNGPEMLRIPGTDLFECQVAHDNKIPQHYTIHWLDKSGQAGSHIDPYTFPPQIADFDMYLFGEGKHWHVYRVLGAHPHERGWRAAYCSLPGRPMPSGSAW